MASGRRNPAIYAGLAGAVAWAAPTTASALTVFGHDIQLADAGIPFVAGCVVGALVASGTTLAVGRITEARDAARQAEQVLDAHAAGKPAWGQHEAAARQQAPSYDQASAAQGVPGGAYGAQRGDADATSSMRSRADVTSSMHRARHSARTYRATGESWETTGSIRVQPVADAAPSRRVNTDAAVSAEPVAAGAAQSRAGRDVFQDAYESIAANHAAQAGAGAGVQVSVQDGAGAQAGVAGYGAAGYPQTVGPAPVSSSQMPPRSSSVASRVPEVPEDYGDVAEAYVHKRTLADRMASRARGVAEVLGERLGTSRMEGLPVITRADGTVGDVGENWWDEALGEDHVAGAMREDLSGVEGVSEGLAGNSAVLFTAQTPAEASAAYNAWQQQTGAWAAQQAGSYAQPQQAAYPQGQAAAVQPQQPAYSQAQAMVQPQPQAQVAPASQQATPAQQPAAAVDEASIQTSPMSSPQLTHELRASISRRVASPAEAFPDHEADRWSDKQQDLWAVALEALDERYDEEVAMNSEPVRGISSPTAPAPVHAFSDVAGNEDSLDEPDGLEASTQFIPFRPQAGHPEVKDTDSYIELLVNQELSRSKSPAVQRSYRDYLRLVDGGTSKLVPSATVSNLTTPRHLAVQARAQA